MSAIIALNLTLPDNVFEEQAKTLLAAVKAAPVTNHLEAEVANDDLRRVKKLLKDVEAAQKELTAPIREQEKRVREFYAPAISFLEEAESIRKSQLRDYLRAQEEIARRAAAEAAEAERKAREALEKAAAKAEAKGQDAKAEALREQAHTVQVVVPQAPPTRLEGTTGRKAYRAQVVDKAAFLAAVAANPMLHTLVDINQGALNKLAAALKDGFAVPGAELVVDTVIASRAA